jgi:hypothetical protein
MGSGGMKNGHTGGSAETLAQGKSSCRISLTMKSVLACVGTIICRFYGVFQYGGLHLFCNG